MDLGFCCWQCLRQDASDKLLASKSEMLKAVNGLNAMVDGGWSGGCIQIEVYADHGAALWAAAEAHAGQPLTEAQVREVHASEQLVGIKIGERFSWRDSLPRQEDLAMVLGQFPTESVSERDRHPAAQETQGKNKVNELYSCIVIQYTTITGLHDCLRDTELGRFDMVAVRPLDSKQLKIALDAMANNGAESPFDMLCLRLCQPNGAMLRPSSVDMANIRRQRVFLALDIGPLATAAAAKEAGGRSAIAARKTCVQSARQITQYVTRGHLGANGRYCNVVLTGGSSGNVCFENESYMGRVQDCATPDRSMDIGRVCGLRSKDAQAALTTACQAALERAELRRRIKGYI